MDDVSVFLFGGAESRPICFGNNGEGGAKWDASRYLRGQPERGVHIFQRV